MRPHSLSDWLPVPALLADALEAGPPPAGSLPVGPLAPAELPAADVASDRDAAGEALLAAQPPTRTAKPNGTRKRRKNDPRSMTSSLAPTGGAPSRLIAVTTSARARFIAVLLSVLATTCACQGVGQTPRPTVCNGVSSEMGGCAPGRHVFTASTCPDLAREWANALDGAVVTVLQGPPAVDLQARSVRIRQAMAIASVDLNERLRTLGLRGSCDVSEVMGIAEPLFSPALRSGVGAAMFDGEPVVGYEQWRADLLKMLQVIQD